MFGLSITKLIVLGGMVAAALAAFAVYRQSLINTGFNQAIEAVKVQDTTAKVAADRAQLTVDQCYDRDWLWSTVTGTCTDPKAKKP